MRKIYIVAVVFLSLAVSACGITKKTLGLDRHGPDETAVQTNNPLILPPEYSVRPASSKNYEAEETSATEE